MSNTYKYCYMCNKDGTSKEHVPPKCFFPENKDIVSGEDYRKNLITVPSCEEHNSGKSDDDSYLLAVIAAHYQNNPLSEQHYSKKIKRALTKDKGLQRIIVNNFMSIKINGKEFFAIKTDHERIINQFKKMGLALYYHEKKEKWTGSVRALTPNILWDNNSVNSQLQELAKFVDSGIQYMTKEGENEDVFYYLKYFDKEFNGGFFKLVFFKGFEAWIDLR